MEDFPAHHVIKFTTFTSVLIFLCSYLRGPGGVQKKNGWCRIRTSFLIDLRVVYTGWWLGHPSEEYDFVNWDDEQPNISVKISHWWQPVPTKQYIDSSRTAVVQRCFGHSWSLLGSGNFLSLQQVGSLDGFSSDVLGCPDSLNPKGRKSLTNKLSSSEQKYRGPKNKPNFVKVRSHLQK